MKEIDQKMESIHDIFFSSFIADACSDSMKVHIMNVLHRLPQDDLDYLSYELRLEFFYPSVNMVMKIKPEDVPSDGMFIIILEQGLEKESASTIYYIIAHELAHAFLGHYANDPKAKRDHAQFSKDEIAADQQVIKWGFEKELKESGVSYLYGKNKKNLFKEKNTTDIKKGSGSV